MKFKEINNQSIRNASNKELLNMHLRCHQLWTLSKQHKGYDQQLIINVHKIIVYEMKRRNFNHKHMSDLDDTIKENNIYDHISNLLLEKAPLNPNTIILKNHYYPKGLDEQKIYDYYLSQKTNLLNYIEGRTVSFFLLIDNKIVVKRNHKGSPIRLTHQNFEELITGRTLSIHINRSTRRSNYIVIDIDAGTGTQLSKLIPAVKTIKLLTKQNEWLRKELYNEEILFTGNGIHYILYFKTIYKIDPLRSKIIKILNSQDLYEVVISKKKVHNVIQFDMVSNFLNSMHVSKYSLSKNGLQVIDFKNTNPQSYKIS